MESSRTYKKLARIKQKKHDIIAQIKNKSYNINNKEGNIMKQLLRNMYIDKKRILLRCDFNVPIKNGNVLDETKIIKSLETINYILSKNCKLVILSHLGRIKSEEDLTNNSLKPIHEILERLLNKEILFAEDILSPKTEQMALSLQEGDIMLVENTRFLDLQQKGETTLNLEFAKTIAKLGELFVFDAFAVAHRSHTTVVGINHYLPSCLGFLAEKEITMLNNTITNPMKPFTVIMGGAKVDDKLPIIKSLLPKCDNLLLSGGIANSFLFALGLEVGDSLKTDDINIIKELKDLMLEYKTKFAFPLDAITETKYNHLPTLKNINSLTTDDIIKDIGNKTITKYSNIILKSNTIFINGTMGVYEEKAYKNGTAEIFNALKNTTGNVIIGGGDTISAINNLNFNNIFENISSGGGATLEYIANGNLPGIEAISEEDNIEILDF